MRLLNLLTPALLFVSGVSGTFQDKRETRLTQEVAHLTVEKAQLISRVERLAIDSALHAKPVVVTVEHVRDSIIIQKKTVKIPVMIPLTGQESLRIGRIEYPLVHKEVMDSFKRSYKPAIGVKPYDQ